MSDLLQNPWPLVPSARMTEIVRTEGVYLHYKDGRKILDACGGAIVSNVGHGRPEVAEAVAKSMKNVSYVVPPYATEERLGLAERLQNHWLPDGVTRIFLTSGGSESTDSAVKLARQYQLLSGHPDRWKVIGRDVSYHGTTLGALAVGGHTARRKGMEPFLTDFPHAPPHYCLRCPLSKSYPGCDVACADELEVIIEREGPETVAAFIAEPVNGGSGGALTPPDEYWPRIREICDKYGILIICDEVMSGFGRTGGNFAIEHWDVTPDIITGGKGLAGGYAPLGGVYATDDVVMPLAEAGQSLMFNTFGGHPTACAAANAVLDIMVEEKLVERAAYLGDLLTRRFASLRQHPHVAEIRGKGLLWGLEFVKDRDTLERFPEEARMGNKVVTEGYRRGVAFYPGGNGNEARDMIIFGPAMVVTDDEIDTIVSVLEEAIDAAAAAALN